MRASLAGAGAREALERGGDGAVIASFRLACYVRLEGGLVALVEPTVHAGPIHLVLDGAPPRAATGARVRVVPGAVIVVGEGIDVSGARSWWGLLPRPSSIRDHADAIARVAAPAAARSPLLSEPFRVPADGARKLLVAGLLEEAARRLVGLGPGLTPSGDDALAGVLFALRASRGAELEPRASDLVGSLTGGVVSQAFVAWAARGQALAPAHDLLCAVVAGDDARARSSARSLASVGETSGADFLLGMSWGLSTLSRGQS